MLSGRWAMDHHDWNLVHCTITQQDGSGRTITHARVAKDGMIYDPVWDKRFSKEVYYAIMQAQPIKNYNWEEASVAMLRASNWGPW